MKQPLDLQRRRSFGRLRYHRTCKRSRQLESDDLDTAAVQLRKHDGHPPDGPVSSGRGVDGAAERGEHSIPAAEERDAF